MTDEKGLVIKQHPEDPSQSFLFRWQDGVWRPLARTQIQNVGKDWAVASHPEKKGVFIIFRKVNDRWEQYTITRDSMLANRLINDPTSPATGVGIIKKRK